MRILLKVNIPVEPGNAAAKSGKLSSTIQTILAEQKPEAVYFSAFSASTRMAIQHSLRMVRANEHRLPTTS